MKKAASCDRGGLGGSGGEIRASGEGTPEASGFCEPIALGRGDWQTLSQGPPDRNYT